jgi:sucrose synthase
MNNLIQAVLNSDEKNTLQALIAALNASEKQYFLRNEILQTFADCCHQLQKPAYFYRASSLGQLLHYTHELLLEAESIWLLLRPWVGSQEVWRINADLTTAEPQSAQALLDVRDRYVNRYQPRILEVDFGPFYKSTPSISDPRNIGQGLSFLNRYLCNQVLADRDYWLQTMFEVLHQHEHDGIQLMINDRISSGAQLAQQVGLALQLLGQQPANQPYAAFHAEFQALGFEPGWGNTAARVRETLEILDRMINSPEPALLEAFVSRFPAIFRVVLISIHGWVGQESVLGRPETMGQVAYVLDQARSLDLKLQEGVKLAGLDFLGIRSEVVILTRLIPNCEGTECNLRLEKVDRTENTWILRVPFREFNPKVTQNWISKFEIWPYLESFAIDAEKALLDKLGGAPNLVIGNYSDGNLVASLLARKLKATQCNIAHSLEKPKYLFSNLYWQDLEEQFHFSAQFAADLISMNAADFIITSSYEEIVGTPDTMGQYESYKCFTMPQLYHVVDGVDLFSPKFNRVPPGVDETSFFPYHQTEARENRDRLTEFLFTQEDANILGTLKHLAKRPIIAVSPLTPIKNLSGLAEFFGQHSELRDRCNLIFLTNKLHVSEAINSEEAREIEKLQTIIHQYQLNHDIRWIGMRLPNPDLGEVYRVIADRQGIFIHFARFESFGRVILEAMISGLPTFATEFGGVLEIIEDGRNGFLINPTDFEATAKKLIQFLDQCDTNPEIWKEVSDRAIQRIRSEYNWQLHTQQLLLLSKLYSFWNYVHPNPREALSSYLEALFYLIYKPRADKILEQHMLR